MCDGQKAGYEPFRELRQSARAPLREPGFFGLLSDMGLTQLKCHMALFPCFFLEPVPFHLGFLLAPVFIQPLIPSACCFQARARDPATARELATEANGGKAEV